MKRKTKSAPKHISLDSLPNPLPWNVAKVAWFPKYSQLKKKIKKSSLLYKLLAISITFFLISLVALYFFILKDIPSPSKLSNNPYSVSTQIFDRNGKLLYEVFADQNRTPIKLGEIPDYVKQATIAIEDRNFYQHQGFAVTSLIRAVFNNVEYIFCELPFSNCSTNLQGASTITQQLVKNALLTPERTFQRKIKEFILTLAVELRYSKDEILEMYLNQIPYGGTSYGLEAASQNYFGKSARNLNLAEASILVGLPVAPSKYSPFGSNPERYKERQLAVLRRMVEDGYITNELAEATTQQQVTFASPKNTILAPHFVLWVKDQLIETYGSQLVETGGLRVTTTLDLDLQTMAEATISAEITKLKSNKVSNGAGLITNPQTGEILVMVGSSDYFDQTSGGNVNLTTSYRQPGSSIKPLNYTLAFAQNNLSPASIVADIPTCFQTPGQPRYCPQNYDGSFHGAISIRTALANSYNIPAVKILTLNTIDSFINFATSLGITGWEDRSRFGLSLTLGGGEVRMIDMAEAYGSIANLGVRIPLKSVLKVTDYKGKLYEETQCTPPNSTYLTQPDAEVGFSQNCNAQRVIMPQPAYLTTHILRDQQARSPTFGGGLNISGHPDVAVKTGTTNDLRDNWTIGFSHTRLVAIWVGNNDNTPMGRLVTGITGAAPIWKNIMTQALRNQTRIELPPPEGIIGTQVCSLTGSLPEDNCPTTFDLFPADNLPTQALGLSRDWPIDKTTQGPARPDTPPEQIEMQKRNVSFDVLGDPICIDCPYNLQSTTIKYPPQ